MRFEVGLISNGGVDAHKVTVEAYSEQAAKEAAVAMANAAAKADRNRKPYSYGVTSITTR
jgi:hypothetical protein